MPQMLKCKVKHWDGCKIIEEGKVVNYFKGYNPKMFDVIGTSETVPDNSFPDPPEDLQSMTKAELLDYAGEIGLKLQSTLNKNDMIEKIREFRKTL